MKSFPPPHDKRGSYRLSLSEVEVLLEAIRQPPAPLPHLWSCERYDQVYSYIASMADEPKEWLLAFYLDDTMQILAVETVAIGSEEHVDVPYSLIFTRALKLGCQALLIAHNHPSGRSRPSKADVEVTRRLVTGCEAIGISLLDHVIIARDGMRRILFDAGHTRFVPGKGFVHDPPTYAVEPKKNVTE